MEIISVTPQGFCGGVKRALDLSLALRKENPDEKITVLGSLVHNKYVNEMLSNAGIGIVEGKGLTREQLLDQVDEGIVVFTAHGVLDAVRQKANEKGLKCVDASCPFVLSTQKLIAQKLSEGYYILYAGKKGHPEAEAALCDPDHMCLIEKAQDIPEGITQPVFVTSQTTMSVLELKDLFGEVLERYPDAVIHDEICSATRIRQEAVLNLKDTGVDALIVIGDPSSNNTRKLAQTGRKAGIGKIFEVESVQDLKAEDLKGCRKVAVTSGASTPGFLKDEVVSFLETLD